MRYLLAFLLSSAALCAATIEFTWQVVNGAWSYNLYWGPQSQQYTNAIRGLLGTNVMLQFDGKQYFALSAEAEGIESEFSRELTYDPLTPVGFAGNAFVLVTDQTCDLQTWEPAITNDVTLRWPAEFFRLRLERVKLEP